MALWLVRSSRADRVVRFRALAGDICVEFLDKTLNSRGAFLHPVCKWYRRINNARGNPAID